jgi:predicted permease
VLLDAPRVQRSGIWTSLGAAGLLSGFEVFRGGAENSTRGGCAPRINQSNRELMNLLKTFWRWLRSLGQSRAMKREIDEELRLHLELRTAEYIDTGVSTEEAAREARRRFGNIQKVREECRDVRGAGFGEATFQDIRFGLRMLRKSPGFTTVVVLSLALGIGANATVLCWIQNILHRPLPGVAKQEELAVVTTTHGTTMSETLSLPDLQDQAKLKEVFAGVVGSSVTPASLTVNGHSEWICGQLVTANFFDVLGVKPLLGRTFLSEEDEQPGGHPVMVISEGLWKRRFGGDPGIVGRTVELNRHSFTIVGVVPVAFHGTLNGLKCEFWAPVTMRQTVSNIGSIDERSTRWLQTQARLRPGVNLAQAQAALDTLAAQLEQAYPDSNKEIRLRVLPLWKSPYGGPSVMLPVLCLLLAVSLGVLLIVMVNVANLLLARATRREKEVAIRLALGAGRGRLIRQLLTESLLLAVLGGVTGVLLAIRMVELIRFFLPNSPLPIGFSPALDGQTLGLVLLLTLATGLIFGLVPALHTSKPHLNEALKEGGRSSGAGAPHHRLLGMLVVSQIALALVLVVCAGLCLKGLQSARHRDPGFDPNHLLYAGINIGMNGYTEETGKVFYHELQQRLAALPGVQEVALSSWFPLGFTFGGSWGVNVEGYPRRPNEDLDVWRSFVSPRYFATLRIPLLDGREFTDQDDQKSPPVAIINEAMAKRFWPGQNPIGRKFKAGGASRTVVGVVKTGRYRSLTESPQGFFYTPYRQGISDLSLSLCVRTTGNPEALAVELVQEIHKLDPGVEPWGILPMTEYIQPAFLAQQIAASLLILLGVVALALAAMGVYGVMAYVVSQRTHEFGIRLALGARNRDVLRLVLRQGLMLASLGVGIGLALAVAVTRLLANFLYGVSPFDVVIFASVPLLLGLITLLACWLPARRAAKVDPMVALRYE